MKKISISLIINKLALFRHRFKKISKDAWIHYSANIEGAGNIEIDDAVVIGRNAMIYAAEQCPIKIGKRTVIHPYVLISTDGGFIDIGEDCSLNVFSVLSGTGGLVIGNGVRIAHHVSIICANHVFKDRDIPIRLQGLDTKGIRIEDDVWIGGAAQLLDGITIGRGSIIGAGAVVTHNIPPYSIAVGIPARVINQR